MCVCLCVGPKTGVSNLSLLLKIFPVTFLIKIRSLPRKRGVRGGGGTLHVHKKDVTITAKFNLPLQINFFCNGAEREDSLGGKPVCFASSFA